MRAPADNLIGYLFTGGGWISIINSILIVFFSSAFAGIFEGAKLLVEVERGVTFLFHTVGGYVTKPHRQYDRVSSGLQPDSRHPP